VVVKLRSSGGQRSLYLSINSIWPPCKKEQTGRNKGNRDNRRFYNRRHPVIGELKNMHVSTPETRNPIHEDDGKHIYV